MTTISIPQIAVPDFWLSNFKRVQDYLDSQVSQGVVREYGSSSTGLPLRLIEYAREDARAKVMVMGGTHGHEPGTVASATNLVHLMEQGVDLAGEEHPELLELLGQVHLYVVPVLNPDGRVVCPDTFYAQGVDTCTAYACGITKSGDLVPYDAGAEEPLYYYDPEDCVFIGGQFNGAGWAINRLRSPDKADAVEVAALFEFVRPLGLDCLMDLHACGYNFAFQVRSHDRRYWPIMREWQRRAELLFGAKGRQLGALHGDDGEPLTFHFNSSLFHRHAKLMWIAYEGRQGYLGRASFWPRPSEWEIVDDYLSAVQVTLSLAVEGTIREVNRGVFG